MYSVTGRISHVYLKIEHVNSTEAVSSTYGI